MDNDTSDERSKERPAERARRLAMRAADTTVSVVAGADSVIRQAGLTTRDGRISKRKLVMAALRPRAHGGRLVRAAATELDRRRNPPGRAPPTGDVPAVGG